MINLKLSMAQAQALHNLLTSLTLEPLLTDHALRNGGHHITDHLLWPVLDSLRQQMQIEYCLMR